MTIDNVSRRRGVTSELTFIAPVKAGKVPDIGLSISYSDRLAAALKIFNERENAFNGHTPVPLGLRAFQGIHFAHLVLLDGNTRFLFAVNFDGSASSYLAGLSADVPWLLHLVFSHCVGWKPVVNSPHTLIDFVTRYQVETTFWYAHAPDTSVRDVEWLQSLRRKVSDATIPGSQLLADRGYAAQVQAAATQACAPRTFARRLAQLFAANGAQELQNAMQQFKLLFGPMFQAEEWTNAYIETFGEAP